MSFSFVTLIPWGRKNAVIPSADTVKKREMYLVTESALFFLIQMEKIVRKYQRNWQHYLILLRLIWLEVKLIMKMHWSNGFRSPCARSKEAGRWGNAI